MLIVVVCVCVCRNKLQRSLKHLPLGAEFHQWLKIKPMHLSRCHTWNACDMPIMCTSHAAPTSWPYFTLFSSSNQHHSVDLELQTALMCSQKGPSLHPYGRLRSLL